MNAAKWALVYTAVGLLYIGSSSALAARIAADVTQLERIETLKGFAFVAVTGACVFAFAYACSLRISRVEHALSNSSRALANAEQRAATSLAASAIAHDASNVLGALLGELELAGERELRAGHSSLSRVNSCVDRLVELNRRLQGLATQRAPRELRPLDVYATLDEQLTTLRSHPLLRGCDVTLHGRTGLVANGDPLLWLQIVSNLLLNAAQATAGQGKLEVRVVEAGDEIVVEVHDNGPGVPAERRAEIFSSRESTRAGGHGLGLFSVAACAQTFGGRVEVADSPLGGALFRVAAPRA